MKCATHPNVETNLRCGKCGKPICPRCMVQTLVGARCPECARLYKLPTYRVTTSYYLKAAGTGLGMAIVTGLGWGALLGFLPFFFLNLLLGLGVGYAVGEVVSLSVNRKRGSGLMAVAGLAVIVSYVISIFLPWQAWFIVLRLSIIRIIIDLVAVGLGVAVAASRLR
jgi:hypothetical protein